MKRSETVKQAKHESELATAAAAADRKVRKYNKQPKDPNAPKPPRKKWSRAQFSSPDNTANANSSSTLQKYYSSGNEDSIYQVDTSLNTAAASTVVTKRKYVKRKKPDIAAAPTATATATATSAAATTNESAEPQELSKVEGTKLIIKKKAIVMENVQISPKKKYKKRQPPINTATTTATSGHKLMVVSDAANATGKKIKRKIFYF